MSYKLKTYIVYYHKEGWFDECWGTPSIKVRAKNKVQAIYKAKKQLAKKHPEYAIILRECSVFKKIKIPKFDKWMAAIFKKDISALRYYEYDIRKILTEQ